MTRSVSAVVRCFSIRSSRHVAEADAVVPTAADSRPSGPSEPRSCDGTVLATLPARARPTEISLPTSAMSSDRKHDARQLRTPAACGSALRGSRAGPRAPAAGHRRHRRGLATARAAARTAVAARRSAARRGSGARSGTVARVGADGRGERLWRKRRRHRAPRHLLSVRAPAPIRRVAARRRRGRAIPASGRSVSSPAW